jgi:colanic acid/amylovoran biosynthesis glycosyltransferase
MTSVLFLMPHWGRPSNLFLVRQIRMLRDAGVLYGVAVINTEGLTNWNGVPLYSLTDQSQARRIYWDIRRRLGVPAHPPTQADQLRKLIRSSRVDTILCQYGTFAVKLLPALIETSARVFIHVHGYDTTPSMCPPDYPSDLLRLSERATIICNSRETRGRLLSMGIPADRLVVKYCGVEVPDAPMQRPSGSEITILHLGRLIDCKSPDRTIQAFELASDRGLQGKLIIAGDGPLRVTCELLRARSKWKDRIEILGAVSGEQGASLLRSADILTLHSIRGELTGQIEAFGVALVEAMAATLPVASCRIGGIPEVVVDGETGILVEPGDVEAQAEALLQLANNPSLRYEMGKAGWRRAKELFTVEAEQEALLAVLQGKQH